MLTSHTTAVMIGWMFAGFAWVGCMSIFTGSFWQHPWLAGIGICPQFDFIILQQARSCGVMSAPGKAHAIAGAT
jgi:hypothetical protein